MYTSHSTLQSSVTLSVLLCKIQRYFEMVLAAICEYCCETVQFWTTVCVARHLRCSECIASVGINKTYGSCLELAVNVEIGKEADDSERRRGVIRGSFAAFFGEGLDKTTEHTIDWYSLFVRNIPLWCGYTRRTTSTSHSQAVLCTICWHCSVFRLNKKPSSR